MAELGKAKDSSLKARDRAIIKVGLGLAIVLAGYLLGSLVMQPKTDSLKSTNAELQERVTKLENAAKNKIELGKKLDKMEADKKYVLGKFPSKSTFEKVIAVLQQEIRENHQVAIGGVGYVENGDFYTFVDKDGVEQSTLGKVASATITATYAADYKTIKDLIKFLNEEHTTRVTINSISMSQTDEEEVNTIEGDITLTIYYGCNLNKYEDPEFDVSVEKENIFR